SSQICPSSGRRVPATTLSRVDLPAPLGPMTVAKSPSARNRSTPWRAGRSQPPSSRNRLETPRRLSILPTPLGPGTGLPPELAGPLQGPGHREGGHHHQGGNQLQIPRGQAHPQRKARRGPVEDGAYQGSQGAEEDAPDPPQGLAQDDGSEPRHNHANTHPHVGEALVLGDQGAR